MIEELDPPGTEILTEPAETERLPHEPIQVVYYMGRRIDFRPIELSDEPQLRRWVNDPLVRAGLLHRGPLNAIREREWIETLGTKPAEYAFGIVVRDEDRLIGTASLRIANPITRSAVFGLLIGERSHQNSGYGTEATQLALRYGFRELNLNRIELSVFADNWRAIRVYQKCGFKPEGCLRQALYRDGRYVDEYRFGILREEWDTVPTVTPAVAGGQVRNGHWVNEG